MLETFDKASGQKINVSKSSIFFGKTIVDDDQHSRIAQVLGMTVSGGEGK